MKGLKEMCSVGMYWKKDQDVEIETFDVIQESYEIIEEFEIKHKFT